MKKKVEKIEFEDLSDIIVIMDQFIEAIRKKSKKKWLTESIALAFISISAQYVVAMNIDKDLFLYNCGFMFDHADKMIEEMN